MYLRYFSRINRNKRAAIKQDAFGNKKNSSRKNQKLKKLALKFISMFKYIKKNYVLENKTHIRCKDQLEKNSSTLSAQHEQLVKSS